MNFKQITSHYWVDAIPYAVQNGNKFRHSNFITFDAKKAKETLMTRLSGITITETKTFVRLEKFTWWKTPLKHTDLTWQLAKMSTFIPFPYSSGSAQSSQAGWLSLTFLCKRKHLLGIQWSSVKLKWGRTDECRELKHMKEILS